MARMHRRRPRIREHATVHTLFMPLTLPASVYDVASCNAADREFELYTVGKYTVHSTVLSWARSHVRPVYCWYVVCVSGSAGTPRGMESSDDESSAGGARDVAAGDSDAYRYHASGVQADSADSIGWTIVPLPAHVATASSLLTDVMAYHVLATLRVLCI